MPSPTQSDFNSRYPSPGRGDEIEYSEKRSLLKEEDSTKWIEEIHTSLYLQSTNMDYRLVIRMPSIEYNIPAKNFIFIKTLSKYEIADFFEARFIDWHLKVIDVLTHSSHFQDYLNILEKAGMSTISLKDRKAIMKEISQNK